MVAALALGLGLDVAAGGGRAPASDALFDADFQHARFLHGGGQYLTEASFLAAVGGVKAGNTRTIGPVAIGPELLANGSFDANVSGWSAGGGTANISPAWNSGQLQVALPGPAADTRFGTTLSLTVGKAYRFGARPGQSHAVLNASIAVGANLLNTTRASAVSPFTAGQQYFGHVGADQATLHLGGITSGSVPRTDTWDDFTLREAVPLAGHNHLALSATVIGETPATVAGNKVVFQADDAAVAGGVATERNRVRLVWDASQHLRLVVTQAGTEQANLDLGVVAPATRFEVRLSSTANGFKANLDGAAIVRDTSGAHPPVACLRIGRSATGEVWDGAIHRVAVRAAADADLAMIAPERAFAVFGDSTARGDGASPLWPEVLRTGYTPARTVYSAAVSGQDSTALRTGALADTEHRRWTTILMDRPNTGESAATWLANLKAAVANLQSDRWLVVPPALNSPAGLPDNSAAAIAAIQLALLADPFFAGHSFDAAQQAAYLAAVSTDASRTADGTHFSAAGQAAQAAAIRGFLDARGW